MKLVHYTFRKLSIALAIVLLLWAVFFYIRILQEVDDETNDSLEYYKELIIKQALADSTLLADHVDIMTKYYIRKVAPGEADLSKNEYYDSFIYSEIEKEYEPVRVLRTYFRTADGAYYRLTINTSTLEKEDMVEAIFWSIVLLYGILLACILGVSHFVFRKSMRPFYYVIRWLNNFRLGKPSAPFINETEVDEFKTLNRAIRETIRKSEELYTRQKEFVENAAHELQTPLAICMNKLELFSENPACTEEQLTEIENLQQALSQIIKLNKSLLLLSRIDNNQFPETKDIDLNTLIRTVTGDLAEIYAHKQIRVSIIEPGTLRCRMNESLAATLVTNLIKNAFVHNKPEGFIRISVSGHEWHICNSGESEHVLPADKLFSRFALKGPKKESTGLGLAIVKAITTLYAIRITYSYENGHIFKLIFP